MEVVIREYARKDIPEMVEIWNEVVEKGDAFPQTESLSETEGAELFAGQTATAVAVYDDAVVGLYILHPNNIGRCGHIANASYAVKSDRRGMRIGEKLVLHSIRTAGEKGFRILQFNAVAATNAAALRLYEKLGFARLGTIPGGFRDARGEYVDIVPHYIRLTDE